jgi:hypothetical protein
MLPVERAIKKRCGVGGFGAKRNGKQPLERTGSQPIIKQGTREMIVWCFN